MSIFTRLRVERDGAAAWSHFCLGWGWIGIGTRFRWHDMMRVRLSDCQADQHPIAIPTKLVHCRPCINKWSPNLNGRIRQLHSWQLKMNLKPISVLHTLAGAATILDKAGAKKLDWLIWSLRDGKSKKYILPLGIFCCRAIAKLNH